MVTQKKNNDKRDLRLSLADLEAMQTHQLADLLSNFVLLLRRLPDIKFSDLAQLPTEQQQATDDLVSKANERVNNSLPGWWVGKESNNHDDTI